jgi:hypothetical protein
MTKSDFHPISGDLPSMNINKFYINQDTLFIGGSKGIWFRPLSQLANSINRFEPKLNEISVYPNPFTETIKIEWDWRNSSDTKIQLLDIQGRVIFQKNNNQSPITLFLPEVQPGLYYLKLTQESESTTKRILKL